MKKVALLGLGSGGRLRGGDDRAARGQGRQRHHAPMASSICSATPSSACAPTMCARCKDSELIDAAIQGMVSNLDPHSSYMDAKSYGDMQITTKGQFGGVGIEVTQEDGLIKVISPIDGTPAAKAGIKTGDRIAGIDGTSIAGPAAQRSHRQDARSRRQQDHAHHSARRREEAVRRDAGARHRVRWTPTTWRREGDIGYIRMPGFNEQTADGPGKGGARSQEADRPRHQGLCAGPAQQSRRPAGSGDPGVG